MSDFNLFELAGKSTRRVWESLLDTCSTAEEVAINSFPLDKITHDKDYFASQNIGDISRQAVRCLRSDDAAEAAHQLKREIYFSSLFANKAVSPETYAAKAGLASLTKSGDCKLAEIAMKNTWSEISEFGPPMFDYQQIEQPTAQRTIDTSFKAVWSDLYGVHR